MYAPNGLNYTVKEEAMADPRMNELYNTMMNDWYQYAGSNSLYMVTGSECTRLRTAARGDCSRVFRIRAARSGTRS